MGGGQLGLRLDHGLAQRGIDPQIPDGCIRMKLVRDALGNMGDLACLDIASLAVNGEARISFEQKNKLLDIVGMVLLIAAVPLILASLFAVFGQIGTGWGDRVLGFAGLGAGLAVFWVGKRLSDEFGPW